MNKKKLKYIIPAIATLALVAGGTTYAATTKGHNPFANLATVIAEKFNLKTADVQSVIDETMAAERQQRGVNRQGPAEQLAQAVTDGKLTQAQADLITAKKSEMKTAIEALRDATQEERQAAMKTQMDTLKQWATDNNIPEQYIMGLGRGTGGGRSGENFTEKLTQAVTDGKLTQAQADLITAKKSEMKTAIEALRDATQEERQAAMKTQMDTLKQWATDNNIPEQYVLMGGFGEPGGEHGFGGPGGADRNGEMPPLITDTTTE
jgi:gas vesicle protein